MSFVHSALIGFFGVEGEIGPKREFTLDECVRLVASYNATFPEEIQIEPADPPTGRKEHGFTIAYSENHGIVLRRGFIGCPCLTTHYILGAICFGAFVQQQTGCSIYVEDRFVSAEEFIPN